MPVVRFFWGHELECNMMVRWLVQGLHCTSVASYLNYTRVFLMASYSLGANLDGELGYTHAPKSSEPWSINPLRLTLSIP